ncbi:CHAT domain-containing protein, partial [Streptomyces mirabilis]|uniref:CHAT domain-containing protein n=1 Tax=Streptomyces mirabilis TaxID=68239 RepID=UPI003694C846
MGVPAFLGTLWSANDFPSALLMSRFYELTLVEKLAAPEALRQAQRWLRDLDGAGVAGYLERHPARGGGPRHWGAPPPPPPPNPPPPPPPGGPRGGGGGGGRRGVT